MVNRLAPAPELANDAFSWALELARGPLGAMQLTKRALNHAIYPNLEQVLDYEAHLQEIAGHAPDHLEGLQAFLEKREPQFG